MPFTLDKLAGALRGIPLDALMLVRLPDGALRQIDHLKPTRVNEEDIEGEAPTPATFGQYRAVCDRDGG
jgi:hypothetical protein